MKKDHITTSEDLLSLMNTSTEGAYYLKENGKTIVISNVPDEVYCKSLEKYKVCNSGSGVDSVIDFITSNANLIQQQLSGDAFKLAKCYENSKLFFDVFNQDEEFKRHFPIKMVLGYVSVNLKRGIAINDRILELENVFIHDWHVWNYVGDVLVDITLFKNHGNFDYNKETPTNWGDAEDHIYNLVPDNLEYNGIVFDDYTSCEKEFRNIFKV